MEHQEGVPVSFIATSSRDKTIKLWQEEDNGVYRESKTLVRKKITTDMNSLP